MSALRQMHKDADKAGGKRTHAHEHEHSHGLFSAHSHVHASEEVASKIDLIEHHRAGSRITLVGMGANAGMTVMKGAAGVYFHSSALLADAAHSLSDILGDLVTLYTFRKSRQPADAAHPYGYGRYEALGTLFISAFLVTTGVGIGMHAFEQCVHFLPDLLTAAAAVSPNAVADAAQGATSATKNILASAPSTAETISAVQGATSSSSSSSLLPFAHSHSHDVHAVVNGNVVVDPRAIWFAMASIVVNELLFQATMKVGKRTKSNVLIANAWHHRSDALTSLVSVGAIGGAIMGFPILDAIGGLAVSAMIAKSGVEMTVSAIKEIIDTPPPEHFSSEVTDALKTIVASTPEIRAFSSVHCRKSGPFIHVNVALEFDGNESAASIEHLLWHVRSGLRSQLKYVQQVDIDIKTAAASASARN
ncbi:mitochondrial metal transporter [Dipsacomyces acuminosporus]|nr:mitochondrial metal transporter [Dipsacomyces acuminosporus]